jgi:cystathionine gamma-synthase
MGRSRRRSPAGPRIEKRKSTNMGKTRINSTDCVHLGARRSHTEGSLTTPVVHCAPFTFGSTSELREFMEGRSPRRQPEYGRMGNPTVAAAEGRLAALEGAERAKLFGSGMAAVTTLFLWFLKAGDRLVLTSDSYRRTRDFSGFLAKFGIDLDIVEPSVEAIEKAFRPETRLVFSEIPTNPYLRVLDIPRLVESARANDVLTVVDSTFATPCNLRPLDLGADLVVHSATKYLGGHNDLIAGLVAGRAEIVDPVSEFLMTLGGICDPNTAFLLERGLKTLGLRVARHNANGLRVARFLESHPAVERVYYPGLESHPDHALASRLMSGFGGVVTFLVRGGFDETAGFVDRLRIPRLAPSLGGVESLVDHVALMSFWELPREERERLGIRDNLVRLALGIEDPDDLIADLDQALAGV